MKWVQTGDELLIGEGKGRQCVGGTGFIISRQTTNRAIEVQVHSNRIAMLRLDIGRKTPLLIIQIYALHKDYGMDKIGKFHSEVETHLDQLVYQKIVIDDFNAQLEPKSDYQKYLNKFTSDTWNHNETGKLLVDFADASKRGIHEKLNLSRFTFALCI